MIFKELSQTDKSNYKKIMIFRPAFYAIFILVNIIFYNPLQASEIEFNRLFIEASGKAKPSVVNIIIYNVTQRKGKKYYSKTGYGSGTIISDKGYIVTNYHVVKKGNFYQIILYDGTECQVKPFNDGKYYIADTKTDITVLKIDESEFLNLKPINFGDSNMLLEGEWVLAIGNPYGLRQSITSGIVSSKGRNDVGFADIEDFIQTDVPINPGNSGGPLVNLSGELVGINTAIRTVSGGYQGISFAIPSNIIKQVSYELIKYGRVRRGWLGFLAHEKKIHSNGEKKIVEVISVIKDSPAEFSGIRKGDVIKEINGRRINTLGELVKSIGNKPVGAELSITLSREGKIFNHSLILREKSGQKHLARRARTLYSIFGIELDENSRTGGILISYLSPMGPAYQNGLKKGDMIVSLNDKRVSSINEFLNVLYSSDLKISKIEIYRDSRRYKFDITEDDSR